jgi:hypothetical protein
LRATRDGGIGRRPFVGGAPLCSPAVTADSDNAEAPASPSGCAQAVLCCADLEPGALARLFAPWGVAVVEVAAGGDIPGSYWGEPEAGIVGSQLFVRPDTPVHSALHEGCHLVCMGAERRARVERDALGDELEEGAVCCLQVQLADRLPGVGAARLCADMDAWGYSFRAGSTRRWLEEDADDARAWLEARGIRADPAGIRAGPAATMRSPCASS